MNLRKIKKNVLMVCVENAGCSQMAEGLFRKYAPSDYEPIDSDAFKRIEIECMGFDWLVGVRLLNQQSF